MSYDIVVEIIVMRFRDFTLECFPLFCGFKTPVTVILYVDELRAEFCIKASKMDHGIGPKSGRTKVLLAPF